MEVILRANKIMSPSTIMAIWLLLLSGSVGMGNPLAPDDSPVFVSPTQPLPAGAPASLWLYCINSSSQTVRSKFTASLDATLLAGGAATPVRLWLNTNRQATTALIAPGGFLRVEYQWEVPASLTGNATLDVSNYNAIAVRVVATPAGASAGGTGAQPPARLPQVASASYLGFLTNHLSVYEPIYFLLGTSPAAEFQFSIKYRIFNLTNEFNPFGHLYFAYTQTSYWDLISKDPSFYDTSYKPSAFLLYDNVLTNAFVRLSLQPGIEHESNGRGGAEERSLNTAYLQPTATFALTDTLRWRLQPRAWAYLSEGTYNPDLAKYRGYGDLYTDFTWTDLQSQERIQVGVKARVGDEWSHSGLWFDLRFNLAGVPWLQKFNPTIEVQYFTGYGQTLRQYNESSHGLRAGLCLWY